MRATRPAVIVASIAVLLFVADYLFALGTSTGLYADRAALLQGFFGGPGWVEAHEATRRLVTTIDVGSLALFSVAVVVLALARGRPRRALAGGAVIAGANLTTHFLKPGLGWLDPFGGDAERLFGSVFPSGHATVAMSATLALMIVLPPSWRALGAVLATAYSAGIGIGMVALGWHFPSDVVGGFLVAAAWAAAAIGLLGLRPEREPNPVGRLAGRTGAAVVAVAGVAAAAAVLARLADIGQLEQYGRLHTAFFAGSATIALTAIALTASIAALLTPPHERLSPPREAAERQAEADPATAPAGSS